jgi:hypothetical protein
MIDIVMTLDKASVHFDCDRIIFAQKDRTEYQNVVEIKEDLGLLYSIMREVFSAQFEQELQSAERKGIEQGAEQVRQQFRELCGVYSKQETKEQANRISVITYNKRR